MKLEAFKARFPGESVDYRIMWEAPYANTANIECSNDPVKIVDSYRRAVEEGKGVTGRCWIEAIVSPDIRVLIDPPEDIAPYDALTLSCFQLMD